MPILDLQKRIRELGRIRLGRKNERGQPTAIDTFRLTSSNQDLLQSAAELYGGQVVEWTDAPGAGRQWELITDVDRLEIAIPPGQSLSQWYEMWQGGGCQRRCDGQWDYISDQSCLCDAAGQTEGDRDCKPTTRLNVMLPELWDIGVWRLETHGYYAAVELGGIVPLLESATRQNIALKAALGVEQRTIKKIDERHPRHFAVPVVQVSHSLGSLLDQAGMLESPSGQEPAMSAPSPASPAELGGQEPPARALGTGEPARVQESPTLTSESGTPEPQDPPQPPQEPEPAPAEPETRPAESTVEDPQKSKRQHVARKMRDAGLDDDERRHLFVSWLFNGQSSGLRDLDADDLAQVEAMMDAVEDGRLTLMLSPSGTPFLVSDGDDAPVGSTPVGGQAPAQPQQDQQSGGWTADDWKQKMKAAHGVGPATLIRKAREMAGDQSDQVTSIDAIASLNLDVQQAIATWLAEHEG